MNCIWKYGGREGKALNVGSFAAAEQKAKLSFLAQDLIRHTDPRFKDCMRRLSGKDMGVDLDDLDGQRYTELKRLEAQDLLDAEEKGELKCYELFFLDRTEKHGHARTFPG